MKLLIFVYLISIIYCGYSWLPSVSGFNEYDPDNGYAGIIGKPIVAVKIAGGVKFRIHYLGKSSWEAETSGTAGDYKTQIDGIAIKGKAYKAYANGVWLPPVTGYNINDADNGYAGILNFPISGLMINKCTYAVAISDEIIVPQQVFVNYGTGVRDISYQYTLPHMEEGCFFMACCVIGGLANDDQIESAYYWALNLGYINDRAWVIGIDKIGLAWSVSQHFGTEFHSGWDLQDINCNHHWVINEYGVEVFNAAGLYYKGNGCR